MAIEAAGGVCGVGEERGDGSGRMSFCGKVYSTRPQTAPKATQLRTVTITRELSRDGPAKELLGDGISIAGD